MFKNPFKKPEPIVLDPLTQVEKCVDALNVALRALPLEYRKIRPFVQAGSAITPRGCNVVLGHWTREFGDLRFVVTYGERPIR